MMLRDFRDFLELLGEVSASAKDLSIQLRRLEEVTSVERRCDIVGGKRPSVEWYVDAELVSGQARSWRLLIYWADTEWMVEADVSSVTNAGSQIEVAFPAQAANNMDLRTTVAAATSGLLRVDIDQSRDLVRGSAEGPASPSGDVGQ